MEKLFYIITVRNEVAKVMFLQACVCPRGGWGVGGAWSQGGCLVPGRSALGGCLVSGGTWFQGVPGPGGLLQGGVCFRGVGGAWSQGVSSQGVCIPACTEADPPEWRPPWERQLLLRTVRILLECILVSETFESRYKTAFQ